MTLPVLCQFASELPALPEWLAHEYCGQNSKISGSEASRTLAMLDASKGIPDFYFSAACDQGCPLSLFFEGGLL